MSTVLRGHRRALLSAACAVACLASLGCQVDLPRDPQPKKRVEAVFDPDSSTIPLPNAAALDSDGTLPKLSVKKDERDSAQAEFYDWLDDLNGWLPEQDIQIPFNGHLQEDTVIPDNFRLVRIERDGEDVTLVPLAIAEVIYETIEPEPPEDSEEPESPERARVTVVPEVPLSQGVEYGALATTALLGEDGGSVIPSTVLFFAFNNEPIYKDGEITIPQLDGDDAESIDQAKSLEGLRQLISPVMGNLDQLELDRSDIASVMTWTTSIDTFTVLDSATATIPLPNTLALDAGADGLPTFPAAALESLTAYRASLGTDEQIPKNAQIYFEEYLDELHGWPNTAGSVPIEVPLSGPVDPSTVTTETVQLWKLGADGEAEQVMDVAVRYVEATDDAPDKIVIEYPNDFELATDYFAFVTKDVLDPNGNELKAPAALLLAMQPAPLVDADGNPRVEQLAPELAPAAVGAQQLLAPIMAQIDEKADLDFDDVASVWTWYTWKDPFIVFDPIAADIPFPNAFLIGEDGTADVPSPLDNPLANGLFDEVSRRDGFSVLGDGWVSVLGELDPTTITLYQDGDSGAERGAIGFADVPQVLPEVIGEDKVRLEYNAEEGKILFRVLKPLREDTLHAAILSDRIRGVNGLPAKPTPAFVMLASEYPLYDAENDEVLLEQLPASAAALFEDARQRYAQLFLSAKLVTGDERDSIVGAFAFTTDNVTESLQKARARTIARIGERGDLAAELACDVDASRDCAADLLDNTDGSADAYDGEYSDGVTRDFSNLQQIQWAAEFDSVNIVVEDQPELATWEQMTESVRVPFSVFVPKEVAGECEPPFRVVIIQHGLTSSRLISGLGIANDFAAPDTCLAAVVPDAVLHGGRSSRATSLHPTEWEEGGGSGFLGVDFVASKNNFAQAFVDLVVLNQVIKQGGLEDLVTNTTADGLSPMFDVTETGVIGTSLGGIFATNLVTLDPDVSAAVFAVAPGKLSYYLTETSEIGEGIIAALGVLGIEQGTFLFDQLISIVQWVADVIDPAAFAVHTRDGELDVLAFDPNSGEYSSTGEVGENEVMVIMARGDEVCPNVSTEQLADILGVSLENTTFDAEHAFVIRTADDDPNIKKSRCARRQASFFLRRAIDGEDTTLPSELEADNCVSAQ